VQNSVIIERLFSCFLFITQSQSEYKFRFLFKSTTELETAMTDSDNKQVFFVLFFLIQQFLLWY